MKNKRPSGPEVDTALDALIECLEKEGSVDSQGLEYLRLMVQSMRTRKTYRKTYIWPLNFLWLLFIGPRKPKVDNSRTSESQKKKASNKEVAQEDRIIRTSPLKNAKAGEEYEDYIKVTNITNLEMVDDAKTGLRFEQVHNGIRIFGKIESGDEFATRTQCLLCLKGVMNGRDHNIEASLTVFPDPKKIWKSREGDSKAQFKKPNDAKERVSGKDILCVAASKRGRSHAHEGLWRDDDFELWTEKDVSKGWNIVAVADGAGSAKFSRRGSEIAVQTTVKELSELLTKRMRTPQIDQLIKEYSNGNEEANDRIKKELTNTLVTAVSKAVDAINDEATQQQMDASDFSTTLILSIARKVEQGWFIAGFSVGDGGAGILDLTSTPTATPLTLPDSGEYAGQTCFLKKSAIDPPEDASKRLIFCLRKKFTGIIVMTDGITDPKFETSSGFNNPNKWDELWTEISKEGPISPGNPNLEQQILDWLDFWSPGNHDDRTIAIMIPMHETVTVDGSEKIDS